MLNRYDWKNIIKRIIIGVAVAFILFNINKCNAYALVYKDRVSTQFDSSTKQGYFANKNTSSGLPYYLESWVSFSFTNNFPIQNTDYLLFQFVREEYNLFEGENTFCPKYVQTTDSSTNVISNITCDPLYYSSNYNIDNNLNKSMFVRYTDNSIDYCWFDSTMQGYAICPNGKKEIDSFWMHYTGTYNRVEYRLQISTIIYLYNNDSTEIVNGLTGMQTQQQQTNTIITDSNTSNSSSTANNGFNSMNTEITQQVDGLASINTYNSIINNFFTQINNSTCSPISLPMPFVNNQNIVLPCIGTEINNSASTLWTFWRFLCAGIIGFALWGNLIAFIKGVVDPYNVGANNLPIGGGK